MVCPRESIVFWDVNNVQGPLKDEKDVKVHLVLPIYIKDGTTQVEVGWILGWARDALLADSGLEPRSPVSPSLCLPVVAEG